MVTPICGPEERNRRMGSPGLWPWPGLLPAMLTGSPEVCPGRRGPRSSASAASFQGPSQESLGAPKGAAWRDKGAGGGAPSACLQPPALAGASPAPCAPPRCSCRPALSLCVSLLPLWVPQGLQLLLRCHLGGSKAGLWPGSLGPWFLGRRRSESQCPRQPL